MYVHSHTCNAIKDLVFFLNIPQIFITIIMNFHLYWPTSVSLYIKDFKIQQIYARLYVLMAMIQVVVLYYHITTWYHNPEDHNLYSKFKFIIHIYFSCSIYV